MKKLTLLLSMLLCCFFGYSQTLYPTVSVIESGDILTINAAGETDASYFSSIFMPNQTGIIDSSPDLFASNHISIIPVGYVNYYNIVSKTPTTFKIQLKNNHPINDYTIKLQFSTVTNGTTSVTANKIISIKIKHAPPLPLTYYNDALSQTFKKNNCGSGFEGSDVTYLVPEKKYSSDSKDDANAKAQAEINANGQNKANAEGICHKLYYSGVVTGMFTKNDCPNGAAQGSALPFTIDANAYSGKSQEEANSKAQTALLVQGQAYANTYGSCGAYITRTGSTYRTHKNYFQVHNAPPLSTFFWSPGIGAHVVSGEYSENFVTQIVPSTTTAPSQYTVRLVITEPSGKTTMLYMVTKIINCKVCPEDREE